ncbi:TPA: hypothetical protein K8979_004311 [Escherichia coli]|uniref:hypothetical protein n=1 Tax=Escherichia coli TaxID=562 RepID=UPI000B50888F|nr:hypothetical protein [Escherichia coli]EKK2569609.1 hypothetical protein [Escherichia coli O103]EKK2834746.1 hypothetical protein [Escherichia coli O33]EEV6014773.1 hypothetical protein [Escherichia coli]EFA9604786.1 hypothetical protein [Escherichia coli]EFQ2931120.1 hypothetical protein [Escherichia coli]
MKVKQYNTALIFTVLILLWVAILVLVKFLFSGSKGFEWGSVSDWVSTFCNAIMAGAALYAAVNAKNWLSEKTRTLGLEKAEAILNEIDTFSATHNSYIDSLAEAEIYYRSNIFDNQADRNRVIKSLDELRVLIENNKLRLQDTHSKFSSLKRWDVTILKEKEIYQLLDTYQMTIMSLSNATFNLRNALSEFINDERYFALFGHHFKVNYGEALSSYYQGKCIHEKIRTYKFRELFYV